MDNNLKKSILTTIVFFDLFDYPLTLLEIWKFLYSPQKKYTFPEIKDYLKKEWPFIEKKNGFYFLPNRQEIIKTKQERYRESFYKYKKAKRVAKIIAHIPFIKLIAIGNFLPENNTKKESDLDFFIISQKKRIWLSRIICVAITIILNIRPTKIKKENKICLTFYTSLDNLNFQKLALPKTKNTEDLYLFYWLATLYPLYNQEKTYEKFFKENNWLKNYLPNLFPTAPSQKRKIKSAYKCLIFKIFNFNFWEKLAKKIQLKILPPSLKILANKDTRVILTNSMLKFHNQDRRDYYRNKFIKKIKKYE